VPARPFTWRFLLRRGWLLAAGACLGLGAAWVVSGLTVSATNALTVQTVGFYQPPYEDDRLALTYARLLPEEAAVVDQVSAAVGQPRSYVSDHLTVEAIPKTNLLIARYSAGSRDAAKAGLEAFNQALRTSSDYAGTQLRESVQTLTEPEVRGGMSRLRALALGGLAGLGAALALALTLERRRPRVDNWRDLARILEVPIVVANRPPAEEDGILVVRAGAPADGVADALHESISSGRPVDSAWFVKRPWLGRRALGRTGTADAL
jgi:hypothetical protein